MLYLSLAGIFATFLHPMTMFEHAPSFWRDRFQASAIHLGFSLAIAIAASVVVFGIWYPYPYREISGGRELFLLVVTVDVILGPLVTLAIFNRIKAWPVLRRDLAIIGMLQFLALGYGVWTVFLARPVHLVFEYDRMTVVHAVEMEPEWLAKAPAGLTALPVFGPTSLSLRPFKDSKEKVDATIAALSGIPLATRADLWQPYDAARSEILAVAKPVSSLKTRFPGRVAEIDQVLVTAGRQRDDVVYLPMMGRKSYWTAFLDPIDAHIVATMPLDSF
jgi:hypothetical protein